MLSSFLVCLLATTRLCLGQYNGSTLTASGQLDSVVQQIAASYFPSSIQPSLAVALGSASVTGDYRAIVSSLITAAAPPPYITNSALAPYSSRIEKAESLISSVQQAVYNATHTTPSITTTETASNGSSFVTKIPAQVVDGSTIPLSSSSASSGATGASGGSPTSSQPASTAGGSGSSSSSKGYAMPTEVPIAAAGLVGLLGALVAL